ncbi:MAG: tRNA (N6-isopentenyl adenosine(37)-C2)-methylthiotransferase MiaB [Bacillales bacterium]|nr:tRNA (N6-isopentenyl adenosine(37)-C2)-methylthiotransferase MiaB [Bacillales bacterium]
MKKDIISAPDLKEARKRSKENIDIIYSDLVIENQLFNYARNKKYLLKTFGCQANVRDGETIAGILENIGYVLTNEPQEADLIILNTCAVRENAEDRVFGEIGHLKGLKLKKKEAIYAICGCMVQQESITSKILSTYPHIDLIFGTHNIHRIPQLLFEVINERRIVVEVLSNQGNIIENLPSKRSDKLKAFVNIMYGCDKFCTYCIVPYTRGKQRSRLPQDIISEVEQLKKDGYIEVTLLGQNVNAYGKDLNLEIDFAKLLHLVSETHIPRIRFVTSHPWDFSQEMINAIKTLDNVMPFVHLPIQSGDDDILRKMGRRYTVEEYLTTYNKLRQIDKISITTDIIVGFPNESLEAFNNTLKIVDECAFDGAFTFIYSKREGTPAALLKDDISEEEKHRRLSLLIEKVNYYALLRNKTYLGEIVEVLVEGKSKRNEDILSGYSKQNKLVNFKGNINNIGKLVKVKINKAKSFTLQGEEIDE